VFARYLGEHPPTDAEAAEAASLVRRLRPLAQQTVDAELARAMQLFATRQLRHHLDAEPLRPRGEDTETVEIPAATMRAVQALVGGEGVAAFVTAAAEREVQARTLDQLTSNHIKARKLDEQP